MIVSLVSPFSPFLFFIFYCCTSKQAQHCSMVTSFRDPDNARRVPDSDLRYLTHASTTHYHSNELCGLSTYPAKLPDLHLSIHLDSYVRVAWYTVAWSACKC
ncbi:uncharacterized protein F4812DRAFT_440844 [Daldinia caldariorum]|uniref:uncharacterized protein n=1 Tax=Daldinia caldariorum TaxID=326644 RepID=UPI0020087F4D|nr:uncharacterized protein F4812DRAFT_440844 [Daldinia caldariorum]KAI1464887.1 hypothetical protein F4812DRAFT_440844 [Daldinia caldariorum]